jgi:hypothetical protein
MLTLDWRQNQDVRSFDHLYETTPGGPLTYSWAPGHVLDQGNIGACTGFGTAGALATMPRRKIQTDTNHFAMAVYELATSRDPYPGDWPTKDTGSSVNGAMRAARDLRLIASYQWATTGDAIRNALLNTGPVVLGVPWYNSMFDPVDGVLQVDTSSGLAGGHCFFTYAADSAHATMRNSWGSSWSNNGSALVAWGDIQKLLDAGAEAAVPIGYV